MDILKPFNHHSREGAPSASESAHPHLHVMAPVRYPKLSIPSVITLCTGKHAQNLPWPYNKHAPLHSTGLVYVQTSSMAQVQILDPFHRLHSLHRHIHRWLPLRVHRPRPPLFPRRPLWCPRRRCANVALHLPHDLRPDHDDGGSDCRLGGQCRLF